MNERPRILGWAAFFFAVARSPAACPARVDA